MEQQNVQKETKSLFNQTPNTMKNEEGKFYCGKHKNSEGYQQGIESYCQNHEEYLCANCKTDHGDCIKQLKDEIFS